jgi:RND family efflux transporter MFP subunit
MIGPVIRRGALIALLLAAVIAAGCSRSQKTDAKKDSKDQAGIPVQVAPAEVGRMVEELPVTGTISALRKSDITAQVSARVTEVAVQEGDVVRAGQVVIRLDRTELQSQVNQARAGVVAARARLGAARKRAEITELGARTEERAMAASRLEQAEAALRQAQSDKARMDKLFAQGAVSKQQVDAADTAYDTARTNRDSARDGLKLTEKGARPEEIDAAKKDVQAAEAGLSQAEGLLTQMQDMLSHTVLTSPIAGVVYERKVEPGEVVSSGGMGDALLRIADPASVYLEGTVPERLAHRVKAGQKVAIALRNSAASSVQGVVQQLVPVADPSSRDFVVRVTFPNGTTGLRPGVFAQARILVSEHDRAVVIPKDALVDRSGKFSVFLAQNGVAAERPVEVGLTDTKQAEIVSGVSAGDSVVVVGAQTLKSGDKLKITTSGGG